MVVANKHKQGMKKVKENLFSTSNEHPCKSLSSTCWVLIAARIFCTPANFSSHMERQERNIWKRKAGNKENPSPATHTYRKILQAPLNSHKVVGEECGQTFPSISSANKQKQRNTLQVQRSADGWVVDVVESLYVISHKFVHYSILHSHLFLKMCCTIQSLFQISSRSLVF